MDGLVVGWGQCGAVAQGDSSAVGGGAVCSRHRAQRLRPP